MSKSFLDYSMSVIISRALPDARDGLKPSQRRILYAMNGLGLQPNRKHSKCAKIVGETMGNYHPHGDMAIYPTLVHMAQQWAMRDILIEGQGNFGSMDGDPPRFDAVHRGAIDPSRRSPHGGYGKGHGRFRRRITTRRRPSLPFSRQHFPICSSTAGPVSPSGWQRTFRLTTSVRSSTGFAR